MKLKQSVKWQETWQCLVQTLNSKKLSLVIIQTPSLIYLPVLLVVLLLLSACSTLRPSQSSVPSGQASSSSPLHHPKTKKPSKSYGASSQYQVEEKSPRQSQRGTSLWSQSPLWERSLGSISHQAGKDN